MNESGNNWEMIDAACLGDVDRVKTLLRLGASPLATDEDGWTALMMAADDGHVGCVKVLVGVSNADQQDRWGQTALMIAGFENRANCVGILADVSDAKMVDERGWTALRHAAMRGGLESVKMLAKKKAVKNSGPVWEEALSAAEEAGHAEVAEWMRSGVE